MYHNNSSRHFIHFWGINAVLGSLSATLDTT